MFSFATPDALRKQSFLRLSVAFAAYSPSHNCAFVSKLPRHLMGFTVVPFGQGFKDMSPPTKELMKLTLEERLTHGGHPVLRWMMDNIYIRTDPAGNIKADKEKSTEKIDGAIATIMGLDRAIRCGNDTGASVYDDRGILFI